MKNRLLRIWEWIVKQYHSVWAWATAALGAIVIWMIQNGKFPEAWPPIKSAIQNVYGFLTAPLGIPRLWYWFYNLSILAWIVFGGYLLFRSKQSISYRCYTKDFFEAIIWRWEWTAEDSRKESEPTEIVAHCPKCDLELLEDGGGVYFSAGPAPAHVLRCQTCRITVPFVGASHAKKLIMRNIRDGSWKERLDVKPPQEFLDRLTPKK